MTRIIHYILENGKPVPEPDVLKWAEWFEKSQKERIVSQTDISESTVSTVFIGLDHNWDTRSNNPILYETMVFGGPCDGEQKRYHTKEEAMAGHKEICKYVKSHGKKQK